MNATTGKRGQVNVKTPIREGSVLPNGRVVCPYCERVVPDACETDETIQLTLLGGVVVREFFECPHCGRKFVIIIVELPEQC